MSTQLAQLQEDRAQYQEQLDLVIVSLQDDPDNAELQALRDELESALAIIDDSIADLKPKKQASPPPATAKGKGATAAASAPSSSTPHASSSASHDTPAFKVKDDVLARWVSGDKAFYPARIMSVTGSATAPMYTVKFKSYNAIETLRAHEIRPIGGHAGTKRKAEAAAAAAAHTPEVSKAAAQPPPPPAQSQSPPSQQTSPPPPPPSAAQDAAPPPPPAPAAVSANPPPPPPPAFSSSFTPAAPPPIVGRRTIDRFSAGIVSSATAQLYPQTAPLLQGQGSGSAAAGGFTKMSASAGAGASSSTASGAASDEPPPKKFKKIKATKQLEAGKSKWQDFNKSKFGKGGAGKKESMFRTPEGVHGRVGFVGAGKTERKDLTRSRHIYQTNDDLD